MTSPTIAQRPPLFSRMLPVSCASAFVFGVVVMTGWALGVPALKTIFPGQVAVKANTAICFVLIGFALWLSRAEDLHRSGWRRGTSAVLAAFVSLVGLISFLEYWYGWNPGIDQLLFIPGPDDVPGSVRPGLMSPLAAAGFGLLGLAVILLGIRKRWSTALQQLLAGAVAIICLFGILDFVLDAGTTQTHISPVTAFFLFFLSFGVMTARTEWGLGALLADAGMGGKLARSLLPATVAIPTMAAWLRWKGQTTGLYSDWMGVALMTVTSVVLLVGVTVWTANAVSLADGERRKAEESARRLASIVTCSNDAIIGKDLNGVVTSWNAGAEAIYGYSAEEMIGHPVAILIPPARLAEFDEIMQKVCEGQRIHQHEIERVRKDGRTIQVSLSVSPVRTEAGKILGVSTIARDITEAKRAEQEIHRASLYTRSLIEASLDPLVTISKSGKIMDVNRATEEATGVSRGALIGSDFSDYFTDPEKARRGYERVFAEETIRDYPLAIRHVSGRVVDVLYSATVFRNQKGEVEGVFAAARDVTERLKAEEALRATEQRVRMLLDSTAEAIYGETAEGKCTFCNPATARLLGYDSPGELLGKDMHSLMHHSRFDGTPFPSGECPITSATHEGRSFHADNLVFWRKDGSCFAAECWSHPLFEGGGAIGSVVTFLDISERKRAQEQVHEASLYVRSLIEASLDPLLTISRKGKITDVNQATEKATGVSRDQLIGSDFSGYFTEPAKAQLGYQRVFAEGHVRDYPLAIRHASGAVMDVLYNATVFRNTKGEVEGVFAAARDVTERKRVEEELRLSRERLDLAQKAGHAGTFDWDILNNINIWTPEVEEVHGLARGEFAGKYEDWESLVLPEDLATARACINASLNSGEFGGEWRIRRRNDGQVRWILARAKVLFDDSGRPARMIGVNIDVTERKQAEEEVRQLNNELEQRVIQRTAQLEAANKELEAFTYSVSHDLRAPLRHISGFSKILTEEFGANLPAEAQRHLQRIEEGTHRMGQLVDDLLNLARVGRRDLSLQVTGLKSLVDEVIGGLKPEIGGRQIEWKIGNLPYADCDSALMKQVFQNLLSNAVKFTRPREHAVIEVGQREQDGNTVVYVRDNGVGFSMKYADKLFGVFQRLHRVEDFEGTGVGLATVQRIIQKHGGRIWAEAELDKGASFCFTLAKIDKDEVKSRTAMVGEKA